jgi:hypothetical protein
MPSATRTAVHLGNCAPSLAKTATNNALNVRINALHLLETIILTFGLIAFLLIYIPFKR